MAASITLSELTDEIAGVVEQRFAGRTYWITAEVSDVKKYVDARRCYLKFIERFNGNSVAELKGVFWSNSYSQIEQFEANTGQVFSDGIRITCNVGVRFSGKYGLNLDVLQIDVAYTLGTLELERKHTLERLVRENGDKIQFSDGKYRTYSNTLRLPEVIQRVALITAPASDGQRDFKNELEHNKYGYAFSVKEFLVQIQGDTAHRLILEQMLVIARQREHFDVVVIVRGGGSQTDFRPFEDYNLARCVARFPLPVFTGIGHDRNTSIVDLMARELKTPTKVAALLIDHNFEFENRIIALKDYFFNRVERLLKTANDDLLSMSRLVKMASPEMVLKKGFAMVKIGSKIITDPMLIADGQEIVTVLRNSLILSRVTGKEILGEPDVQVG